MISKCLNWQGNYWDKMKTRCQECGESTWSPPQHILRAEEGCTRQWSQMTGPRRRREPVQLSSLNFLWDLDWWDLLSSWFKYALIAVHKCVGRPHFIQYTIKNCCFFYWPAEDEIQRYNCIVMLALFFNPFPNRVKSTIDPNIKTRMPII